MGGLVIKESTSRSGVPNRESSGLRQSEGHRQRHRLAVTGASTTGRWSAPLQVVATKRSAEGKPSDLSFLDPGQRSKEL